MSKPHAEIASPENPANADAGFEKLDAEPRTVAQLWSAGLLDDEGRLAGLRIINGPLVWWSWIERMLLYLGLTLVFAGIVCFFAWNWDGLPGLAKLAIVQAGIVACCGVGWWKGVDTLAGQGAMISAAALVGVFLAVFGQVYQTGADAYQLFVGWAILILPWVLMCRLSSLWFLWLALVNLATTLWWEQVIDPRGVDWQWLPVSLGLLNGAAAALREVLADRGWSWLALWLRSSLILGSLVALLIPAMAVVWNFENEGVAAWVGLLLLLAELAVLYLQFRVRRPDLLILTGGATAVTVLASSIVLRILWDFTDDAATFLLSGLAILGLVTLMTRWLMTTARAIREQSAVPGDESSGDGPVIESPNESPESNRQILVGELLTQLAAQERLNTEAAEQARALLAEDAAEERPPWYVQALAGLGAWIASLLFLSSLHVADLLENSQAATTIGICLLVAGVLLSRAGTDLFVRQSSLALGLTGFGLTCVSSVGLYRDLELMLLIYDAELLVATICSALLTAVFYRFYDGILFRFTTCLSTLVVATLWGIWDNHVQRVYGGPQDLALHVLVLLETLGLGLVFLKSGRPVFRPAGYALALGLLGTMLLILNPEGSAAMSSLVMQVAALVWLLYRASETSSKRTAEVFVVPAVGAILLGVFSAPGLLAALTLMILGHLERDSILKGLGVRFVPVYLVAYYYSLETTLMTKSLVLIGTGILLWVARWYIDQRIGSADSDAPDPDAPDPGSPELAAAEIQP